MAEAGQDDDDLELCEDMQVASIPKQIRNILNEYPDDAQILKEMIQNADDAEASEMKILFEGRPLNEPHKGDKLLKKFYRAPALCIYNNAKFTAKDWKGIKMIGDSVKENDPYKVGKFGLGFKSAFHLTDFPMIVSDDRVLFMNPLANNDVRTILLKNLRVTKNLDFNDFMKSMESTFGFTKKAISDGKFEGTIFWFPLRNHPSKLSSNIYTEEKILDLLQAFMSESHQMLLFLKYLRRIRLYVNMNKPNNINPANLLQTYNLGKAREFYSIEITNDEYIKSRRTFTEGLQKRREHAELKEENLRFCYEVAIMVRTLDKYKDYSYLVTHFLMGTRNASVNMTKLQDDKVLSSIPLVGVAAPLCQHAIKEVEGRGGHIFCFQPLPQDSENHVKGLPVHINAQFALSQNRRHVKWASENQETAQFDRFIQWNTALIKEVLPEAYFTIIIELIERSRRRNNTASDVNAVYRSIPFGTDKKWQPLTDGLFIKLLHEAFLFTEICSGKWIKYYDAVFAPKMKESKEPVQTVYMLLKSDNVNIVHLPEHVRDRLRNISKISITELSPFFVCQHMRRNQSYNNMDKYQKEDILLYLTTCNEDTEQLTGLKLLPLSNETYTEFMEDSVHSLQVFVEPYSTVSLLPGIENRFVSTEFGKTFKLLQRLSKKEMYQLRQLSWTSLVKCLEDSLGLQFGFCTKVTLNQVQHGIWSRQVERLWDLVGRYFTDDGTSSETMRIFQFLPLFPLTERNTERLCLNALHDIYLVGGKTKRLSGKVIEAFIELGVHVIDKIPSCVNVVINNSAEIQAFFHTCSCDSIDSLLNRLTDKSIKRFNSMSSTHSNCEEHSLVHFLASILKTERLLKSTKIIRRLRIWQQFQSTSNAIKKLVSLEETNLIYSDRTFPVSFPEPMIITRNPLFAKRVGGREITTSEICVGILSLTETLCEEDLHLFLDWLLDKDLLQERGIKILAKVTKVVERILDHVEYISRNFTPFDKLKYLGRLTKIYTWLNENADLKTVKDYLDVRYATSHIGCVWTGEGFHAAGTVTVDPSPNTQNYAPFLNRIATEHAHLKRFFIEIGCIRQITLDTYLMTLSRIKDASDKSNNTVANEKMRTMSIDILNTIQREYSSEQLKTSGPIYVPIATADDAVFKMMKANKCTYCHEGWHENEDDDDVLFVHSDVPQKTAEAVGVLSITQQFLTDCEGFEEWGQSEPLTRRLNKLLKDNYHDGVTVAKELFQNAEDAGASCMRILYDERENKQFRDNLLSPAMEEMQGPALWIYNDACFSDEDFVNITKLNGATKEKDSSKVGKFGLGFCSVYNVTDVPSILSRDKLVIFDPNIKFLQQALPGKKSPGMMIDFKKVKNKKMISKCRNQFQPFQHIWSCDIATNKEPYYHGTIIRLPLRTKASEISDNIYTNTKVQELLLSIMTVAGDLFIFTQNIKKLEVLHLPKWGDPASGLITLFKVTCNRIMHSLDSCTRTMTADHEFKNKRHLQSASMKAIDKLVIKTKTRAKNMSSVNKATWLVSWCTTTNTLALNTAYCGLGAVAVSLNEQGSVYKMAELPDGFSKCSHVFYFLPLPITHNLPFHINGDFGVTNDRQFLHGYSNDDSENTLKEWNTYLLQYPVTDALVFLLEHIQSFCSCERYTFYTLWPCQENNKVYGTVNESFYRKMITGKYKILKSNDAWLDFSQCLFLDPKLTEKDPNIAKLALEMLLNVERKKTIVDIPPSYYTQMLTFEREVVVRASVDASEFLLDFFLPQIEEFTKFFSNEKISSILVFAVKEEDQKVDLWLKNNNSIPSKPEGKLICPKRLIHPDSSLSCLFSEDEHRFPEERFANLRSHLERLGMRMKNLDDDDVIERAKTISKLNRRCSECACERQQKLIEYLENNLELNQAAIKDVQQIDFVPVLPKPQTWPFLWKLEPETSHFPERRERNCMHEQCTKTYFAPPCELYVKCRKDLVGCVELVAASGYKNISPKIKFKDNVPIQTILQQLDIFAETYKPSPEIYGRQIVFRVYQELEKRCRVKEEKVAIKSWLTGKKVVFVSNTFIRPEYIARTCTSLATVNCAPYLYILRDSPLYHCQELCSCLNIQERFSSHLVAKVVGDIYKLHGDTPLNDDMFSKMMALLKCLSDCIKQDKLTVFDTFKIYVPDTNKMLKEATDLTFDNKFDKLKSGEENFIFAHPEISAAMAKSFGILSRSSKHILNFSEDIGGEDFYQEEPLVRRIHNILDGFPCDVAIFKELLQNADDAGATEIHFINDKTSYPTDNFNEVLSPLLQNSALCVYNNKGFSAADLKGITQLGKGSKSEDPFTTGQYGVGFNAVYNLTDVPSFITTIDDEEVLCIFDPLEKHIRNINLGKPGKRYNNLDSMRQVAPNMFKGYHEDKLQKGTVFRFPLRQEASDISDALITSDVISELFDHFQKEIPSMLIFCKNLVTIRLSECTKTGFKEICCVEARFSKKARAKRSRFMNKYKKFCKDVKSDRKGILNIMQIMENFTIDVLKDSKPLMRVYVVLASGFKNPCQLPDVIRDALNKNRIGLFPVGGVALCTNLDDNYESTSRAYCFLPLPEETGLPVHVNGHFALDHETRRGLWKLEKEEEEQCVKFQWNMAIINRIIVPSLVRLIQLKREHLFAGMTKTCKLDIFKIYLHQYECLLPCEENVTEKYWKSLSKSFYRELVNTKAYFAPYLQTNQIGNTKTGLKETIYRLNWIQLQTINANDMSLLAYHQPLNGDSWDIGAILFSIGMQMFNFSERIVNALRWAGYGIKIVNVKSVIDFLTTYTSTDEGSCNVKVNCLITNSSLKSPHTLKSITKFCLSDKDYFVSNIQNLPLVMTQDERLVKVNNTSKLFVCTRCVLPLFRSFPKLHNRFIHHSLVDEYNEIVSSKDMTDIFKKFDIEDFFNICSENDLFNTMSGGKRQWDKRTPPAEWIKNVFDFVMDDIHKRSNDSVKSNIMLLKKLSLVPVTENDVSYLYPASETQFILSSELLGNDSLKRVLLNCNIPTIDKSVFLTENVEGFRLENERYQDLCSVMSDFSRPSDMFYCLNKHINLIRSASLNVRDAKLLFTYAEQNIEELKRETSGKMQEILKEMPIFLNVDGTRTHIDSRNVIICSKDDHLPYVGLDLLQDTLFLQSEVSEHVFYSFLGFDSKPIVDVYVGVIFPNHLKMKRGQFYSHVKFVLSHCKERKLKRDVLQQRLQSLDFIGKKDPFLKISQLFNHENIIFKEFCLEEELLPQEMRDKTLLTEYKKLGLQDEMTISLLKRFAEELSSERVMSEKVKFKSQLLCEVYFQCTSKMEKNSTDVTDLKDVSTIKFLVAASVNEELSSVCPGIGGGQLTSFRESVLYSLHDICWTTCSLLPVCVDKLLQNKQNRKDFEESLGIKCKPTLPQVIQHCKNLGKAFTKQKTQANVELFKRLWENIYAFMQFMTDSDDYFPDSKELQSIPLIFCPERKVIVPAINVVIDCTDNVEILPYLYRAPHYFGKFNKVFVKLGASEKIYTGNYVHVLSALAKNVNLAMLPPERQHAIKAIKGLISCLKQASKSVKIDNLFLPCNEFTLQPAKCIVICDNMSLKRRLGNTLPQNLKYFIECGVLDEKAETIVECMTKISADSAPHMLSSLVKETVKPEDSKQQHDEEAQNIMMFLRSPLFIEGVLRIIKHYFQGREEEWKTHVKRIQNIILNIELRHVRGLKTVLHIRNFTHGNFTEYTCIDGSEEDAQVHLFPEGIKTVVLFQNLGDSWYSHVKDVLSKHITESLHKDVTPVLEGVFLFCSILDKEYISNPHAISTFLDQKRLKIYTLPPDAKPEGLPIPGMYVPRKYYQYLNNTYGEIVDEDFELVAYELDCMETDDDDGAVETYIYAKIICKTDLQHQNVLFQTYEVDIGKEKPQKIPGYRLYTFKRTADTETDLCRTALQVCKPNFDNPLPRSTSNTSTNDIKAVYKEIRDTLRTAWTKPENEKKQVIKRLFLTWHPDKNHGNENFCTKVFQYIQQCIERLEGGESLTSDTEDDPHNRYGRSQTSNASSDFTSWFRGSRYGGFSRSWHHYEHGRSSRAGWSSFFAQREYEPCPRPAQAKAWMRQAQEDLEQARINTNGPGYYWVCYMSHQAVEKSLTAAWYAKDANKISGKRYNHNLSSLLSGLDPSLAGLCERLESADTRSMRYPDVNNRTAGDRFTQRDALAAISSAEDLISAVIRIYNIHV